MSEQNLVVTSTGTNMFVEGTLPYCIRVATEENNTITFDLQDPDDKTINLVPTYIRKSLSIIGDNSVIIVPSAGATNDILPCFNIEQDDENPDPNLTVTIEGINFQSGETNQHVIMAYDGIINVKNCNFYHFGSNNPDDYDITIFDSVTQFNLDNCVFEEMKGTQSASIGIITSIDTSKNRNIESSITNTSFNNINSNPDDEPRNYFGILINSQYSANISTLIENCNFHSGDANQSHAIVLDSNTLGTINTNINNCNFFGSENDDKMCIGIFVESNSTNNLSITNSVFTNMHNNNSGGSCILFGNTHPVNVNINNSQFGSDIIEYGNTSFDYGGAIGTDENYRSYITGSISDCSFINNATLASYNQDSDETSGGGAIRIVVGEKFTLENCIFTNNQSNNFGGAASIVCLEDSEVNIINNNFNNNTTDQRGTLNLINSGSVIIDRCIFRENSSENNTNSKNNTSSIHNEINNGGSTVIQSSAIVNNTSSQILTVYFSETENEGDKTCIIQNSTIANNKTPLDIDILSSAITCNVSDLSTLTLLNNTIGKNILDSCINVIDDQNASRFQIILNNNIIDNNSNKECFSGFTYYYNIGSSNNNFISHDEQVFINTFKGTNIVNPHDNVKDIHLGNLFFQNDTYILPLGYLSPLINAGNTDKGYQGDYDQRGPNYARVIGTFIDIGAFEFQEFPIPCFDGDSMVVTRNIETQKIGYTRAKKIYAGIHEVFDIKNKRFIPVKHNAVIDGAKRLVIFEKDSIGPNKPNQEFKITAGHMMFVNGKEVKARYVEGGKRTKVSPQKVYSIVTDLWTPIKINGLDVFAWSEYKWKVNTRKNGIIWYENTSKH